MANPQKENGYVPIANEIVDKFCHYRLSGEEWLVLWVILRKTYGFNKPNDRISLSQFAKITRLKRQTAHRAIKKLSSKKIIGVINNGDSLILSYYLQKNYDKWGVSSKKITVIKKDYKLSSKKITKVSSKKIPTKDNIQKTILKTVRHTFRKPSVLEIQKYCTERHNGIKPERFFDFYESKGWMVGRNKMVDWKAAVRNWEKDNGKDKPLL